MSAADAARATARGLGELLITAGLVVLLFCLYELKVTDVVAGREQDRLGDELARSWALPPADGTPADGTPADGSDGDREPDRPVAARPAPPAVPGGAFARLHAPALDGYGPRVVVEGVSTDDLQQGGPGHIPGTALPGQVGNVVLSGHRTTYGAPFARWDELDPGEQVVLETRDAWFTYTVTGSRIVAPTAVEVAYAVPGDAAAVPTERLLTMTTCHPRYSARQRLVVTAELTGTARRADGPPASLAAGG